MKECRQVWRYIKTRQQSATVQYCTVRTVALVIHSWISVARKWWLPTYAPFPFYLLICPVWLVLLRTSRMQTQKRNTTNSISAASLHLYWFRPPEVHSEEQRTEAGHNFLKFSGIRTYPYLGNQCRCDKASMSLHCGFLLYIVVTSTILYSTALRNGWIQRR